MTVDAFNPARFSYNGCGLGQDLAHLRQVQVEGLSFLTRPGSDSPSTFDLSCIADWRELSGLYFQLQQPADFVVPPEQWACVGRLSHLHLGGEFRPGLLDFTDRCAGLIQLTADCAVFDLMAGELAASPSLRLVGSPKDWGGESLGAMRQLQRLHVDSCKIRQLPASLLNPDMANKLTHLKLAGCKSLNDLSALAHLPAVQHLHIEQCPRLTDFSFLVHAPQLRTLTLPKAIAPELIEVLTQLEWLDIVNPKKSDALQPFLRSANGQQMPLR